MKQEQIKLGEVGNAYDLLAKNITKAAKSRAAFDKLVETAKQQVDLEASLEKLKESLRLSFDDEETMNKQLEERREIIRQSKEYEEQLARTAKSYENQATFVSSTYEEEKQLKEVERLFEAIRKAQEEMDKIAKGVDPFDLGGGNKDKGIKSVTDLLRQQVDTIEAAQQQYEKYLEIMSSEEAVIKVRSLMQFKDIGFNPNEVDKQITKIY